MGIRWKPASSTVTKTAVMISGLALAVGGVATSGSAVAAPPSAAAGVSAQSAEPGGAVTQQDLLSPLGLQALRGSWKGACHPSHPAGTKKAGGWCDGNGPNWQYWAYVNCSGGHRHFGPHRWMGDRRGSWATCKSGESYRSGGLYTYYYVNP